MDIVSYLHIVIGFLKQVFDHNTVILWSVFLDSIDRKSDLRGSPDVLSPRHSSLYNSQVQAAEYSPSPRKYHVASMSHSPAGDHLVDSMLGKDTDSVRL